MIPYDIAILGGGASGTLVVLHLLRAAAVPLRIALVEPGPVAHGIAYATPFAEHLLNVPAARMSAFDDAPDDFLAYLAESATGESASREHYAQRRQYAAYLQNRLQRARQASRASLDIVADRAVACRPADGLLRIELASGGDVHAQHVVLALGNVARPLPVTQADTLPQRAVLEAWDYAGIRGIGREADVTVVGSGLSMVDVALSLAANAHRGVLHVVSRHALLPLPHLPTYRSADYPVQALAPLPLRARVRRLRDDATALAGAGVPWQDLMNALRPQVRRLWHTLDAADQRRFLRHVARYWDIHRHRIAPQVHATLARMRGEGRLRLHRGRIAAVRHASDGLEVEAMGRDGTRASWRCEHLVNATGVELRAVRMRQPLLDDLLGSGVLRAGPHGLGVDTDADGTPLGADGRPQASLSVIGSLRIGRDLESIAVPDLRRDAARIAARILSSHGGASTVS